MAVEIATEFEAELFTELVIELTAKLEVATLETLWAFRLREIPRPKTVLSNKNFEIIVFINVKNNSCHINNNIILVFCQEFNLKKTILDKMQKMCHT